jgi:hypothetical protein
MGGRNRRLTGDRQAVRIALSKRWPQARRGRGGAILQFNPKAIAGVVAGSNLDSATQRWSNRWS